MAQCLKRRICREGRPEEMLLSPGPFKTRIVRKHYPFTSAHLLSPPSVPSATMKTGLFLLALICAAAYTANADVPPGEY